MRRCRHCPGQIQSARLASFTLRRCPMHKMLMAVFAFLCLVGSASFVMADDAMKGELDKMKADMKADQDSMKADMKAQQDALKAKKEELKGKPKAHMVKAKGAAKEHA